ncbi:Methyltransferase [Aspergillus sp. HF37]|nr:Methyltransferase [Aspergillus sp. HF37]
MGDPTTTTTAEQQPHDATGVIKPDDDPYATEDPEFLSEAGSSTQSLSSSVLNYQYENGRRYHAYREGQYIMPNDDREQERMDLHHHVYRLAVGGALFRAPFRPEDRSRILDLGTGTGLWAIEVADEFPKTDVTGIDLSPIQPGWVPPNCYFEVNDYESPWDYSKPFDFIHARSLGGSVQDYHKLFESTLQNLNNGGWAEFVDFAIQIFSDDDSLDKAPYFVDLINLLDESSTKFGKRLNVAHEYKQWMIDAGFKNVQQEVYKIPMNPWAKNAKMKELGRFQQVNMLDAIESYSLALFTRVLGWSPEEVQVFLAGVRRELVDRSLHIYGKLYFTYGQREDA